MATVTTLAYLAAAICFIMALRGLSSPETSRGGNRYGIVGMAIAILATVVNLKTGSAFWFIIPGIAIGGAIGTFIALRIQMTALPQLVAAFHSLVGLAAVFVAIAAFLNPGAYGIVAPGTVDQILAGSLIEMSLGAAIGAITFTGSIVAFTKLQGLVSGNPLIFPMQHPLNAALGILTVALIVLLTATQAPFAFWLIILVTLALGFLLILPIGGADMPVVISMLNSYSGWAACGIGFTLQNNLLIIVGALVGSSGAILSYIMCKGMNRSIFNVILGGFGGETAGPSGKSGGDKTVKSGSAEDAAFIMKNAQTVIVVPGYGMAVAQAQHSVREMGDLLKKEGVTVKYAIHPVAGRMPGHMNVLLAEAEVPYDQVHEMEDVNGEFGQADVAIILGANDVVNPAALQKGSPIYGMPILEAYKAKSVIVNKRSMAAGYAGLDNDLFYMDKTMMVFGDAKKVVEDIGKAIE